MHASLLERIGMYALKHAPEGREIVLTMANSDATAMKQLIASIEDGSFPAQFEELIPSVTADDFEHLLDVAEDWLESNRDPMDHLLKAASRFPAAVDSLPTSQLIDFSSAWAHVRNTLVESIEASFGE